ncbi:hypothetical protein CFIMG_001896RA [Ceratocystis fimbriata CBS 114723]|uniref:Hyaluronan synthase 2 n=1 Tax=Ceratocystis fimbriata CBS 114723 TaxID=1035309 RepID=A0A2C5X1Q1_9PEZI|nr:hypothetical protein CFIMG_001896RA [Ceratocystis fimbriata CBS 114723]
MRYAGLLNSLVELEFYNSTRFWVYFFWALWLHRYVRLIVHCISHWCYKSYPLPEKPKLTSQDVTIIVPTIHTNFKELLPSLQSILNTNPATLMLVTTTPKQADLIKIAKSFNHPDVQVLATPIANKRLQVCEALPKVKTDIIVMADDDVTWPYETLSWLLAPFDHDERIGGVGTCQRVRRLERGTWSERCWNWLGAAYIERRNFEISATHNIDGGTSCMSGRTGAYRKEILSSTDFLEAFKTERWGKYTLNADDDNFVTRWLVSNRWKTWIHQQPWCTYALHIATFTSLAFVVDPLLIWSCWRATQDWEDRQDRLLATWALVIFMFGFTKVVKLIGLFRRDYSSIVFLPLSIAFGYFHGLIKLYALFTLKMTSWGSRTDGDQNDDARLTANPRRAPLLLTPGGTTLARWRSDSEKPKDLCERSSSVALFAS